MSNPESTRVNLLRPALCSFAMLAASDAARAEGVRIVDPTGTMNFATIQAAVDAAVNGDVILVAPGNYAGFTIPYKSLTIAAASTGAVSVQGNVRILGLPADRQVALLGFQVFGDSPLTSALWVSNCAGHVLLQDSSFQRSYAVVPSVELSSCFSVAMIDCSVSGGSDSALDGGYLDASDALRSSNSSLAAYDCVFVGGNALSSCDEIPGNGGWGYRGEPGSFLLASGTFARGGKGSDEWCQCWDPGIGGPGFAVTPGGEMYLLDVTAIAGPPSVNACGGTSTSLPPIYHQGGVVQSYPGSARKLGSGSAVISDNTDWPLAISGQPGDRIYFPSSRKQGSVFAPNLFGVWLIDLPTEPGPLLGVVPSSGTLAALRPGLDVPPALTHRTVFSQVVAVDSAGKRILGPATARIVLNRESGPDCNGNGVQDYIDVIEGLVPDVNHNLIPDTCPGG